MRLPQPFYKLPVQFDAARLREEVALLPRERWASHPSGTPGNSALRLITVDGGENDDMIGVMKQTPALARMPYVRQVLASFGVVWSRSRFMRLAPGATVAEHADINHHWHYRVRIHIPVVTRPEVRFHCGGAQVHMAAGETWIFDSWRQHRVENPTDQERIHLVADTTGSAAFWRFVSQVGQPGVVVQQHGFDPAWDAQPLLERIGPPPVMHPSEVELLVGDLRAELAAGEQLPESAAQLPAYHALLDGFCRDWRQMYLLHGEESAGWPQFAQMREQLRQASRKLAEGMVVRSNGVQAHRVLEARVLRSLVPALKEEPEKGGPGRSAGRSEGRSEAATVSVAPPAAPSEAPSAAPSAAPPAAPSVATPVAAPLYPHAGDSRLRRPLFIVAAPRSGSTLLYETLAASPQLSDFGGEAHWLAEASPELRPGAPGVDSNRLVAAQATDALVAQVRERALARLLGPDGAPLAPGSTLRLLEKTPKNSLRVPFFERVFPDAQFIFLWREPRGNLGSIIEAWRTDRWITYEQLAGFEGPWSLLLPPGWQQLPGRDLGAIAALQWEAANRIALDDLRALPRERWTMLEYGEFVRDPRSTVQRLCAFAGLEYDAALQSRLAAPLPHSRYTQTPPSQDKWRRNAALIEPQLGRLAPLAAELAAETAAGAQSPKR